jgi:hypothetical protein
VCGPWSCRWEWNNLVEFANHGRADAFVTPVDQEALSHVQKRHSQLVVMDRFVNRMRTSANPSECLVALM